MTQSHWLKAILGLLFFTMLASCGKKEEAVQPGPTAIAFFDAIYNKKDLRAASKHTTPQMGRIITHYKTVNNVQRHLFNLKFDEVEIAEDKTGTQGALLPKTAKKAKVVLMLEGKYQGKLVRDLKTLVLVKQEGNWKVEKIASDPYGAR